MPKKKQQKTIWITDDTLQSLSKFQKNIRDKESKRVNMINIKEKQFIISLEEWKNMVANRLTHSFNNNFYVKILLSNFKQIYDRCVPCIHYHYLRHPDQVLSIRNSESSYFEGYVQLYCIHKSCCDCNVKIKIKFFLYYNRVEGVVEISGTRQHDQVCI